jgi:sugar O-acyltransferase (sialic acid O-acetyltransferase NeuD family)
MTDSLILIGGGGHCRACIDVIESAGITIAGILDKEGKGKNVLGYPVIGSDDQLKKLKEEGHSFIITVGQIKTAELRIRLYRELKALGASLVTIIAPSAHISRHAMIGEGSIIMHQAVVNAAARVGVNSIVNNKALIEHDCLIGDHCHISTAAVINGGCTLGNGVFIGSNAVLVQGVQIANEVVIGAGSVVVKNIEYPGIYAGQPARSIKE